MKVCEEEYPKIEGDGRHGAGFYMEPILKKQLDFYIQNVTDDWDFTIIICGEGEVRVGKSVLAMQIGRYWTSEIKRRYGKDVPFNVKDNFVFNGSDLIKHGNKLGRDHPYSCLVFDEAGADLEGVKAMKFTTQAVKDYLRECGQYNMLNVLVLPEYFDLPKGIAISRSACLINVYYVADDEGFLQRGYFKFYSRPNKKYLYINGKRDLNYNAWKYDFFGRFNRFYTIDEAAYREEKKKALKNRELISTHELRKREHLKAAITYMKDNGLSYREIAEEICKRSTIKLSYVTVGHILGGKEVDEEEDEP